MNMVARQLQIYGLTIGMGLEYGKFALNFLLLLNNLATNSHDELQGLRKSLYCANCQCKKAANPKLGCLFVSVPVCHQKIDGNLLHSAPFGKLATSATWWRASWSPKAWGRQPKRWPA